MLEKKMVVQMHKKILGWTLLEKEAFSLENYFKMLGQLFPIACVCHFFVFVEPGKESHKMSSTISYLVGQ